jgi:hypothetical protein
MTEWLRRVLAAESSDQSSTAQGNDKALSSSQQEMQSSRSTSRTSRNSLDEDTTVKAVGRPKKLDWDKMRARQVDEDASEAPRVPHLKSLLQWKLPGLSSKQVKEVQAIFQQFAQLAVREVDYP